MVNTPLCLFLYFVSKILCKANKTVLGQGDMLRFPQLAETMAVVAQEGADAFYTGKIGQDLVKDVKEAGWDNGPVLGWLTEKTISGLCFLPDFRWSFGDGGFEELPSERRRRLETLAWEYSHVHPSTTYWGRPASLHSSINERFLEIVCFWLATAVNVCLQIGSEWHKTVFLQISPSMLPWTLSRRLRCTTTS